MGQDRKLYVSGDVGIKRLNDNGVWVNTNLKTGSWAFFGMGRDGKLYVSSGTGFGIKRLNDSGAWEDTNRTIERFNDFGKGQDGKLYVEGDKGIFPGLNTKGRKRLFSIRSRKFRLSALNSPFRRFLAQTFPIFSATLQ
jgi:hypothetical protein